ncbi:hypothetical protein RJ639_012415 [Escallonia herrerae]|uniref:Uncharacterized protein n=1 Tax=Escallonia herrerae TaxID=1293975 RepID=A0AA88VJL6_9ASTE|nr:hypothetical protein RJ639_012415 [Escallonia herrerae]
MRKVVLQISNCEQIDMPGSGCTSQITLSIVEKQNPKEELKRKITMPKYLCLAILEAIKAKDVASGKITAQARPPPTSTSRSCSSGTRNDLSTSFGWGGSHPHNWKSTIKRTIDKAIGGKISRLDNWNLSINNANKRGKHPMFKADKRDFA